VARQGAVWPSVAAAQQGAVWPSAVVARQGAVWPSVAAAVVYSSAQQALPPASLAVDYLGAPVLEEPQPLWQAAESASESEPHTSVYLSSPVAAPAQWELRLAKLQRRA
jgi:hypothetical protein